MVSLKTAPKMCIPIDGLCLEPRCKSEILKENLLLPVYLVFHLNGNKGKEERKVINYFGR